MKSRVLASGMVGAVGRMDVGSVMRKCGRARESGRRNVEGVGMKEEC